MPSYLEREQLVPIKPFMAPMQAILNTYATRLGLWGAGAAQTRAARDNYASLDLTREDNQAELNGLMDTANKSISASIQTDLSVADNRTTAMGAFTPINQNQSIMGDHANTMRWNAELSKADNARIKNGGKEFNQASYDAIQAQKALFREMPKTLVGKDGSSIDSWKVFLSSNEKYTPYYDKTTEMAKLQDMFKTDVVEQDSVDGAGRINTTRDASWYRDKWQQFVETNATPQLRNQLAIEAKADYRKTLLANLNNPQAVYNAYNAEFTDMLEDKKSRLGQQLAEVELKAQGLNKNGADYEKLKAYYGQLKKDLTGAIVKMTDPNNKDNYVKQDIGDASNLLENEAYVSQLSQHKYFNEVGKAFAHQDIKQTTKMDGAYWALQNLEARKAEMVQDANQFQASMDFKYTELKQDWDLAMIKEENDKIIAGMKKNEKGEWELAATSEFSSNANTPGEKDFEKYGKELYDTLNGVVGSSYGKVYDNVLGEYFGSTEFLKQLGNAGESPFKAVTTDGGIGDKPREQIGDFLANAYWDRQIYSRFGITTTDPIEAKKQFKDKILNEPASYVKKLLYDAMGNKRLFDQAAEAIKSTPEGRRFMVEVEKAESDLKSTVAGFDSRYGADVARALSSTNYPKQVDPDSELYKLGVRGYEQDGKYRVPSKAEIETFTKSQYTKPLAVALPKANILYDKMYEYWKKNRLGSPQDMNDYIGKFLNSEEGRKYAPWKSQIYDAWRESRWNKEKFSVGLSKDLTGFKGSITMAGDLEKVMSKAIGQRGAAGYNENVGIFTRTEKNKESFNATLYGMTLRPNNKTANESGANKLIDIIKNNLDAVQSYQLHSDGINGKPYFTITVDQSKLNKDQQDDLPDDPNSVKIFTDSEAVPLRYRAGNEGYAALLQRPKAQTINYMGRGDVKISIENVGNRDNPNFKIEGSMYAPVKNDEGDYIFNPDGSPVLELINGNQFNKLLQSATKGQLANSLTKNPMEIYNFAVNQAYISREIIELIKTNKVKNEKELQAKYGEFLEELQKIK